MWPGLMLGYQKSAGSHTPNPPAQAFAGLVSVADALRSPAGPGSYRAESAGPCHLKRGCRTPLTSTSSRNIAAGRTHRPRWP